MNQEGNILQRIATHKQKEVSAKKSLLPAAFLKQSPLFNRKCFSLSEHIISGSGIIAEFKRRSPSKEVINQKNTVAEVVKGYEKAGASGISVLGDVQFFGGSLDDLILVRDAVQLPVLRKEFIIDPYQLYEAKAYGADVVLLIAAILTKEEIADFSKTARQLGMEVLLEVHNRSELEKSVLDFVNLVGVNNRNLKTFEVRLDTSRELAAYIPEEKVKVSESGISSVAAIRELKEFGYRGFLIGENFMKTGDPGAAAAEFIKTLKR